MTTNERAGLTNNAWVRRIDELRQDLENQYSATVGECSHVEVAEWMLSDDVETEYDQDDADFLMRDAARQDAA